MKSCLLQNPFAPDCRPEKNLPRSLILPPSPPVPDGRPSRPCLPVSLRLGVIFFFYSSAPYIMPRILACISSLDTSYILFRLKVSDRNKTSRRDSISQKHCQDEMRSDSETLLCCSCRSDATCCRQSVGRSPGNLPRKIAFYANKPQFKSQPTSA